MTSLKSEMFQQRIHFVTGDRDPSKMPLLLLMGYSGSIISWTDSFLVELSKHWPIIAIDLAGTGKSKKQDLAASDLTYQATVADITDLLGYLGYEKAHLLGYSYGGTIALAAASLAPRRLASLLLVATILGGKSYVPPDLRILKELATPPGATIDEKTEAMWRLCIGNDKLEVYRPVMLSLIEKSRHHLSPGWVLQQHLHNFLTCDFTGIAGDLHLPVTVMTGDEDPLTPPQNSVALANAITGAKLITLKGCRHMPHIEMPREFIDVIIEHLTHAEVPT